MQQKLQTRAFEQVAPILQPGEQPLSATRTMVGNFSSGRLGSVVKQGLLNEGFGALGSQLASNRKQFVVATDRRLIFLAQTFLGGPSKKVLGEVPREHVSVAEVKPGLVTLVRISFGALGDGVALTFPRIDKKNAEALAAVLGNAPVV